MTVILDPSKLWVCPSCGQLHRTSEPRPHLPTHPCPALHGLSVPYVEHGTRARHVAVDRADYVGSEIVQTDDRGRPVAAVRTERYDGSNDVHVYAPTATNRRDNE